MVKSREILMVNSLDSTYGSTHRFRKFYYNLVSRGWKVKYLEANYSGKEKFISFKQSNNAWGFISGTLRRAFYALVLQYDLFFTQTVTPLTLAAIITAKLRGKKVAVDWDDLSWVLQKNAMRSFLVRFCEHKFIKFMDAVFVPNKYLLDYGRKLGAKSIFLAPHGVDFDIFDPRRFGAELIKKQLGLGNRIVLGFLASFTTGGIGDLDIIFEAAKTVMQKKPGVVSLLIIGGGPLLPEAKKKSGDMGLDNIYFTGLLGQEEVPAYLSCVDVALIFMRDNLKNKMKTSLKVGEYLAMNKLVVGHLVGQTRDDFAQYCLNCEGNINSFAAKILEALEKTGVSIAVREGLINKYAWDKSCRIIDEVLCKI
jgi:hypothetical protein